MKASDSNSLIPIPIASGAASGNVATIPTSQAAAGDGRASMTLGWPPECGISVAAGGSFPELKDANGMLNIVSSAVRSMQAWGVLPFNASFSTAIGGYPKNAVCVDSSGVYWVSGADNNTTVPGASGATWTQLFAGYATQAWATGQFVSSTLSSDANNIGAAYFGYRTDLGYAWMSYLNSSSVYVPIILADRNWSNSRFLLLSTTATQTITGPITFGTIPSVGTATAGDNTTSAASTAFVTSAIAEEATFRNNADETLGTAIANESSARAAADTTLQTNITNETTRAQAAEALKANLSGGNAFTGAQSVAGGGLQLKDGNRIVLYSPDSGLDPSSYLEILTADSSSLQTLFRLVNSSGTQLAYWYLNSNGKITGSAGTVALVSQLPTAGTITNGTYTKVPLNDGSGQFVMVQTFTGSMNTSGGVTISFPVAYSVAPIVLAGSLGSSDSTTDTDYWVSSITTTSFFFNTRNFKGNFQFFVQGIV